MIKYTIDGGEPFEVDPQNEKQFLIDNPNAKKVEDAGKEESSSTETSTELKQVNETNLSQNNQQQNTESSSEDGSLESQSLEGFKPFELGKPKIEEFSFPKSKADFKRKEENKKIEEINKNIESGKYLKYTNEKIENLKSEIKDISAEDWASMTETDKELNIDGWKDLDKKTKQEINYNFEIKAPLKIDEENGIFGKLNLEDPMFWSRQDWDHREAYFNNLFKPLVENESYTITKRVPSVNDQMLHRSLGNNIFSGVVKRQIFGYDSRAAENKLMEELVITHKDSKEEIIIREQDKSEGQGKEIVKFLNKTMSESDRAAVSKFQSNTHSLYSSIEKKFIDPTKDEKNSIRERINNMDMTGTEDNPGVFGYNKYIGKDFYGNDEYEYVKGEYDYLRSLTQKKQNPLIISYDSIDGKVSKDYSENYRKRQIKDEYVNRLNTALASDLITKEQYDEYMAGVKSGELIGQDIKNPNQLILPTEDEDGNPINPKQAFNNYIKNEVIKLEEAKLTDKKLKK